jgi:hypothetical protein
MTPPLIAKEIRLLLPAFVMALALAVIPVWLLPNDGVNSAAKVALYPFCFGVVMLALSAFGREFGLQTFSLLLAQPLERGLIWRTKISVLSLATATVFAAWYVSCAAAGYLAQSGPGYDWMSLSWQIGRTVGVDPNLGQTHWSETLISGGTIMAVTFAGGLWTTLLLRQVAGAFWFTVLIPAAITMVIELTGGPDWMLIAALGLYSFAGFSFARWQFLRAQDAAWTGDVISFPGRQSGTLAPHSRVRAHRPLAALFQKELLLHQVGLVGIGGLFLLHLAVVAMRKAGAHAFSPTVFSALQVFGGIWLLVPLLVAAPSVAEERKLGTFDGLICLPVRNRIQFAVKLCFVMAVGGLLSAVLFWTAEGIGGVIGAGCDIPALREPFSGHALALLCLISFGLSLIGFYASTLARGMVQSLAAGVVAACGVWVLGVMASDPLRAFGIYDSPVWLWQGALVHYIGWPTLTVAFLWLGWRNFRTGAERGLLWRRNVLGLTASLVFIAVATTAIYRRAWELVTPLEPRHGPARITKTATLHSSGDGGLAILPPDRRL